MSAVERVGIVGAGTMGAGIAGLGCRAGHDVVLCDVDRATVEAGAVKAHDLLRRGVRRGRLTREEAGVARERLSCVTDLEALDGCQLVVEAVPEALELKRPILRRLGQVAPGAVLASNTSSIPIALLADGVMSPERVLGLHFFNPPASMPLVELVETPDTAPHAVALARRVAEGMGKTVVSVADGPGFLVNRCARPFYLEALRLVERGIATPRQVDRICRLGGGLPMGPFELMDLVGIDVGLSVTESMWELSGGEPRWRPSPIQHRMVRAGRLGRKTGGGFYGDANPLPVDAPAPPAEAATRPPTAVAVIGSDALADELRARIRASRVEVTDGPAAELVVTTSGVPSERWTQPVVTAGAEDGTDAVRTAGCTFSLVPPLATAGLVELARGTSTDARAADGADALFRALGFAIEWVHEAPGLVLGRIVAQLVNEAAFAADDGVAAAEDIDRAMTLALGYPRGPRAWGAAIGCDRVVALLDALRSQERDPRYRVASALRRAADIVPLRD